MILLLHPIRNGGVRAIENLLIGVVLLVFISKFFVTDFKELNKQPEGTAF
jgi:hypothetical protein